MKKYAKIRIISLFFALLFCFSACDLSSVLGRLPYDIESWHEHSWDNWDLVYDEENVNLICSICSANVKSHPISKGLEINDGVLVGRGGCKDQYIVVPQGVTAIGESAFSNTKDILGVLLPDSVKEIRARAFISCDGLQVINIPDGVTAIGDDAFFACKALIGVLIPNSVKSIGKKAFSNCGYLEIIYYVGTQESWDAVSKGKDWNKGAGKHVVEFKMVVGEEPFAHVHIWSEWVRIKEPTTTEEGIKQKTCLTCGKIKTKSVNVILPITEELKFELNEDGTGYIVSSSYSEDEIIVIPAEYEGMPVIGIGDHAFHMRNTVKKVYMPDSITFISVRAFAMCDELEYIRLSDSLITIGEGAFDSCTSLKSINIPYSVVTICDGAFCECFSLESVNFEEDSELTAIRYSAFLNCTSLKSINMPASLDEINSYAFQNCFALEEIKLNEGITYLGYHAFSFCYSLAEVYIPASVTEICEGLFFNCKSLKSINVDKNNKYYQSIDGNLYSKDGKIFMQYAVGKDDTSLKIVDSVTNIYERAFSGNAALLSIKVDKNNKNYTSIDGNLYTKDTKTLLLYAPGKAEESFSIPSHVEKIGSWSFYECKNLKSITIPASVKRIDPWSIISPIDKVKYEGNLKQWGEISIDSLAFGYVVKNGVECTDGNEKIN